LKDGLNIFHQLNARTDFILFLLFLTPGFYFTHLTSILTELMIVLEKTFQRDILRKGIVGKVTFVMRVIQSAVLKTLVRDRFVWEIVINKIVINKIFSRKRVLTLL